MTLAQALLAEGLYPPAAAGRIHLAAFLVDAFDANELIEVAEDLDFPVEGKRNKVDLSRFIAGELWRRFPPSRIAAALLRARSAPSRAAEINAWLKLCAAAEEP